MPSRPSTPFHNDTPKTYDSTPLLVMGSHMVSY